VNRGKKQGRGEPPQPFLLVLESQGDPADFGTEEARKYLHLEALGVWRNGEDYPDVLGQSGVEPVEQVEVPILGDVPEGDVGLGLELAVLGVVDV
jgi:hypothetical protein